MSFLTYPDSLKCADCLLVFDKAHEALCKKRVRCRVQEEKEYEPKKVGGSSEHASSEAVNSDVEDGD